MRRRERYGGFVPGGPIHDSTEGVENPRRGVPHLFRRIYAEHDWIFKDGCIEAKGGHQTVLG